MRENIMLMMNLILSNLWMVVFFGILHMLLIESKTIFHFIKAEKRKIRQLEPLLKRSTYIILGILIIMGSYVLVNFIISTFLPSSSFPEIDYSAIQVHDFFSAVKYWSSYAGLFAVIGFIVSGICLTLSAGGRWLVNLSKLFATLSVLYLFFTFIVVYA